MKNNVRTSRRALRTHSPMCARMGLNHGGLDSQLVLHQLILIPLSFSLSGVDLLCYLLHKFLLTTR